MNRTLQLLNLLGILVLAGVCTLQWQANRAASHTAQGLEQTRLTHEVQLAEKTKIIAGQQSDLDALRLRLEKTSDERDTAQAELKTTGEKLVKTSAERDALAAAHTHDAAQLTLQANQFQKELNQWQAAVKARDAALKKAGESLTQIAADRNAGVSKYNELADKYNALAKERDAAVVKFNDLVAKYNALAKQVEEANAKVAPAKDKGGENGPHLPGT